MPIYHIPEDEIVFPHPSLSNPDGILGIGGDLSIERLLVAYQNGIFPWYGELDPIMWWSPDPRCILFPENIKVRKSMRSYFNQDKYRITFDTHFEEVITACQRIERHGQSGTWIIYEMKEAYIELHKAGYAHSLEVWLDDKLAGGLYGVSLGRMFFGESMFSIGTNASKFALISLAKILKSKGFTLIDCQQDTPHIISMGAENISRQEFLEHLNKNKDQETYRGSWSEWKLENGKEILHL